MFKPTLTSTRFKTIDIPGSNASITIKYIKPGEMQDIVDSSMKLGSSESEGSASMQMNIKFNMSLRSRNIVRACMDSWSGFTNKSGGKLKFSAGALEDMIKESTEFVDFVVEEHEKYAEEIEGKEDEAEKNS